MKDHIKRILLFIPIIIMVSVILISSYLFDSNKNQTYERVKSLKEEQVQSLARQVDRRVKLIHDDFSTDPNNIQVLKESVEHINDNIGIYCYLFDKDCNLISDFSKFQKRVTGEKFIEALVNNQTNIVFTHEYHGYITTTTEEGDEFLVYWQGVPSGPREECEYFIILSVAKDEVQQNEAISSCKIMIGVLIIVLTISLYGNILSNKHLWDE